MPSAERPNVAATLRPIRQAMRVFVRPNPARPGEFLVVPLPDGSSPPSGSQAALLVMLEPKGDLFG
jgi:hypothetical protein